MICQIRSQTQASFRQICQGLELPRSSFYHAAETTASQIEERRLASLIEKIFKHHRRRYSYRRIRAVSCCIANCSSTWESFRRWWGNGVSYITIVDRMDL